jgi:ABC-type transporter Mla subunit MlaD
MKRQRNAFWAGLFIIVSLVLILGVIIGIKGIGRLVEPTELHIVAFRLADDVGGLRLGDDVRVGGLRVGSVRRIELLTAEEVPQIVIHFSLPQRVTIRDDAKISVQTTVTGTTNLNLESLGEGEAVVAGQMLRGSPSTLQTLMAGINALAPEITGTVSDLRTTTIPKVNVAIEQATQTAATFSQTGEQASGLVQDIRGQVPPLVDRFSAVADSAREALDHAGDILGESKGDVQLSMGNIAQLTEDLKEQLPPILEKMDALVASAQTSVEGINSALEDIKAVAANTRDITGSARSLITGNQSRFDRMILSLRTTSENLKAASAEIRRSPWRLLYKPRPGEMANLNLYDSARQFAEGANNLSDAAAALRDAMKDPNIEADQLQPLLEQLHKTFDGFEAIERELWESVRS